MTLLELTDRVLATIEARDVEELSRAVEARAEGIASGVEPTPEAFAAGERAVLELSWWKQKLAFECARLAQFQSGVAGTLIPGPRHHVDYRG
jgi:hypothetical protein